FHSEFHISGVLINGTIRSCSVENESGIADVPRLQACEAAIPSDLVLEHELEHQIAIELQPLRDNNSHQAKTDCDASLVVHRAAPENRIRLGIDMAGERRMRPFSLVAGGLNVEMAVQDEGAAATSSRQPHDDVVSLCDRADGLAGIGMALQRKGIHRYQDWNQSQRCDTITNPAHNGMLSFEVARGPDQFLQDARPLVGTIFNELACLVQIRRAGTRTIGMQGKSRMELFVRHM